MFRSLVAIACLLSTCTSAMAAGISLDMPMTRIFACKGPDGTMEIYMPQMLAVNRNVQATGLGRTVTGLYILDLTEAEKGKVAQPVRLRSTKDNKAVVIEQFTTGLKPVTIPMQGGKVDFDKRFGTDAQCEPYRSY